MHSASKVFEIVDLVKKAEKVLKKRAITKPAVAKPFVPYSSATRSSVNSNVNSNTGGAEPTCFECSKVGHIRRDCPVVKKNVTLFIDHIQEHLVAAAEWIYLGDENQGSPVQVKLEKVSANPSYRVNFDGAFLSKPGNGVCGAISETKMEKWLEAGVVTEESKKFDGDDLEMKHLEGSMETEFHRVIDLVGGKVGNMLESSRSKGNEEVVTLMREVHVINNSNRQEAQPKKTNPNPKSLPRIRRTNGEGLNSSQLATERSPVSRVTYNLRREGPNTEEIDKIHEPGCERNQEVREDEAGMPQGQSAMGTTKARLGQGRPRPRHITVHYGGHAWHEAECSGNEARVPCDTDSMLTEENRRRIVENAIFGKDSRVSLGSAMDSEGTRVRPKKEIAIDPLPYQRVRRGASRRALMLCGLLTKRDDASSGANDAAEFAKSIRAIHEEIRRHLADVYAGVKERVDRHRGEVIFSPEDLVMLYIEKGHRTGVTSKLFLRKSRPYRIIWRYRKNAYELDIPGAHSHVVNDKLLTQFYGDIPSHPVTPAPDVVLTSEIDKILDSRLDAAEYVKFLVHKRMEAPIYIYYQLDNYYQNHRRYAKSRSDRQLVDELNYNDTSSCKPEESNNGVPIVPCGLIAWSLFNDTYTFVRRSVELKVNRKNISWKSDRNHKFGKHVYPFNFQNSSLIGGGKLDPALPLSDQEDLIVWMRTAALPSFRKLYGRIEEDIEADELILVDIRNNYNTYSFGGKKKLVLSTSSWLGGKNDFLGFAYVAVGSFCIFISFIFTLLHVKNPRILKLMGQDSNKQHLTIILRQIWTRGGLCLMVIQLSYLGIGRTMPVERAMVLCKII
ncbi:hypothetical protein GIB67_022207, partial [Kingdonia uniflora]